MVKRITLFRIICFCLLAACAASCQSEPALGGRLRGSQFRSSDRQRQERGAWRSSPDAPLPDAPSALVSNARPAQFQSDIFRWANTRLTGAVATGVEARLLFLWGATPGNTGVFRETQVAGFMPRSASVVFYDAAERAVPAQKDSAFFLDKYLYPPTLAQGSRYQASSSDGLMGRATDAASRIFWTRDDSGTRRLNTSYFLRVATWIAADTASRPYWKRSGMAPISDFGSTIGNDAGMNLFHEFGPDLGQAVSSHLPKFVSRILVEQNSRNSSAKTGGTTLTR